MFFVPLIHLKVKNWNEKKLRLLDLYSNTIDNIKFTANEIYTDFYKNNFTSLKDVECIFDEEIKEFCSLIDVKSVVLNSWFELARKNSHHTIHNHGALGYSSVCFIKFNSEHHTPTKFISPFLNFLTGETIYYYPNNIEEGSIIFFPSSINHYTDPNISDEERLIISFNLNVK